MADNTVDGVPQPAGPLKTEGVLLRRCATVTSTSPCQDEQHCCPHSHPTACWLGALVPQQHVKMGVWAAVCRVSVMDRMISPAAMINTHLRPRPLHSQPFASLSESVLPPSSSPASPLGCSRGRRRELRGITGCRLPTATCTLLTLEIRHATSTWIPCDCTDSPQVDRRLDVSMGPSVCQQGGIMPITSIRMWTHRNPVSAGTWGKGLLGCQDSPQKPHEPEAKAVLSPVGTPMLRLVYPSCSAEYEGRRKHLCWGCKT